MAKKNTMITALIVAAVVGGGIYFYNKRKQDSEDTTAPGAADKLPSGEDTTDATVTAKTKGDVYEAVETAKEIAANVKDAVVAVKDASGEVVAEVSSGNGKRKRKLSRRRIKLYKLRAAKNCEVIKNRRRKALCKKRKAKAIKWLEAHNVPYNE